MSGEAALLLLADSQLLFRPEQLPWIAEHFAGRYPRAAYIGAANGNRPAYFDLACAGLDALVGQSVPAIFIRDESDLPAFPVDILILAGGSVVAGWQFLQREPVKAWLETMRTQPGGLVIGVSAGAIHMARGCDPESPVPSAQAYLDWFPHFIAVHEEDRGWPSQQVWQNGGNAGEFFGIPLGGGLWVVRRQSTPVGSAGPHVESGS